MADNDYDAALARLLSVPPGFKIVVLIAASVALMVIDQGGDGLAPARNVIATIAAPFQAAATLPGETIDYLERYFDRGDLINRNDDLVQQNLQLQVRLQKLAALKTEVQRLRALLGSAGSLDRHVQIARILSSNPDPYRQRVKLDKGSVEGVFVGQALIDAKGIVGQVVRVSPDSSHAVLITDPNHGIPVEINRNGLETVARGTGRSNTLELPFLPANSDIKTGDLLVSSGLAGRYPSGYPVARVTQIDHRSGGPFLRVTARPTASLSRGREVLLVWNRYTRPDTSKKTGTANKTATKSQDAGQTSTAASP